MDHGRAPGHEATSGVESAHVTFVGQGEEPWISAAAGGVRGTKQWIVVGDERSFFKWELIGNPQKWLLSYDKW